MEFFWDVYPAFQVGDLTVRWYSVIYAATLVISWLLIVWQVERGGGQEREANWLVAVAIAATFVGGRLGHLVFYEWGRLVADPSIVFNFREGGIASHGGAIALLLFTWGFARVKSLPWLEVTDRITHAIALGSALIRIGNLFNSEVVGRVTDQTWGIRFPYYDHSHDLAPLRHPSQLYEFALGLFVFAVIAVVDRRRGEDRPRGLLTALFLALYFPGRFVVEFFKEYQTLSPDFPLTMGQLLSIPAAVGGWVALWFVLRRDERAGWASNAERSSKDG